MVGRSLTSFLVALDWLFVVKNWVLVASEVTTVLFAVYLERRGCISAVVSWQDVGLLFRSA
jgi:hypothetical protein